MSDSGSWSLWRWRGCSPFSLVRSLALALALVTGWGRRGRRVGGRGSDGVFRCFAARYRGLLLLLLHLFNNAFRRVQSIHLPLSGVIGRVRIEGGLTVEGLCMLRQHWSRVGL